MAHYIDADRLIAYLEREAEIEFKKTEENANSPVLCYFHNGCKMQALDTIDFIKQIRQEHPSLPYNLDEAAENYASDYTKNDNGNGGDDWEDDIKITFKAGAEWMAGQKLTWKDVRHIWWTAKTILQSIPDEPAAWPEWAMSTEGRFTHILNELHYE